MKKNRRRNFYILILCFKIIRIMAKNSYTLFNFLEENRIIDKNDRSHTHTSMGKPLGSFKITEDKYDMFCELYHQELVKETELHLIEKHKDVSPIVIDLDFKFDLEYSKRQYTITHIKKIIELYNNEIKDIFKLYSKDDEKLTAFVFERDNPYQSKGIIKDGIHIMYPYIVSEPNVQYYIRENVLKKMGNLFDDIHNKNNNYEIIDKAVIFKNGWFLFGSTKPKIPKYELTYIIDSESNEIPITEYHFNDVDNPCAFFSIRNKKNSVIVRPEKKHLIDKIITNNENLKKRRTKKGNVKNKNFVIDDSFRDIIMNIDESKADDFTSWINIGLALHNIDPENDKLIDIWRDFSQKSSKYEEGVCEKYWKTMNTLDGGVSIGSLYHWSKESNPERYNEIRRSSIQYLIDRTINSITNHDIAKVLFEMNKFNFVYSNKIWYEFKNHRYHVINDGMTLKSKISNDLCNEYQQLMSDNNKIISCDDPDISEDDRENLEKKNTILNNICIKLKTTKFKKDVMEECKELFIKNKFEEKLDTNKYLIGFENGVYDLKKLEFREGTPDDYIYLSTKVDYIPFESIDEDDEDFQDMIHFLETVFVDDEVRHYFLKVLASCLQGHNAEEKFRIWTGTGCHSKDSLIMMYDGTFKPVQDIIVGELLMGDDNKPRTVLELKRGFGKMFKITPHNDYSFTVNDEHILCLKSIDNEIIEIKVIDYINSDENFKEKYKYLYLSEIEFEHKSLSYDIYRKGLQLEINDDILYNSYFSRSQFLKGLLESKFILKSEYFYMIETNNISSLDKIMYLIKSLGHFTFNDSGVLYIFLGLNKLEFDISEVDNDNYYGFQLDSNHRYLDSNFITHHNSNGKSKLEELFINSFGDYCINFPITLLTQKRAASNAATPEIAQSVGRRFGYFEEPSEGERINAGLMKEMTGGSTMKARNLFKDAFEFKPQFKLHLLCNDIPSVPPMDSGTWRRMEIIEFKSKFCENPDPNNPLEFPIDRQLSNKIAYWKEYFMSYLIEKYKDYLKEGVKPPNEVIKYTKEHQKECDLYVEFIQNNITESKGKTVIISTLYDDFSGWYHENFGNNKQVISKKEFKKYLEKKLGKKNIINDKIKDYVLNSEKLDKEEESVASNEISDEAFEKLTKKHEFLKVKNVTSPKEKSDEKSEEKPKEKSISTSSGKKSAFNNNNGFYF